LALTSRKHAFIKKKVHAKLLLQNEKKYHIQIFIVEQKSEISLWILNMATLKNSIWA